MVAFERIDSEEVAKQLNISPGTVRTHCSNAMKKLRAIFGDKALILLVFLLSGYSNN
jgi:DNA-directed RNA polymerase specialized sigma24 family protein